DARRFLSANPRACLLSGYTSAELLALPPRTLLHPEDRDYILGLYDSLRRAEIEEFSAERRWIRKDGKIIWVSTTTSLFRAPDATPLYTTSVVQDVTSRKEAELALQISQERFRLIQAATGVATWEWEIPTDSLCSTSELLYLYGRFDGNPWS